jgi:hypothetical protein
MCSIPDSLNMVAPISDAPNTAAQLYHLLAFVSDDNAVHEKILILVRVASIRDPGAASQVSLCSVL